MSIDYAQAKREFPTLKGRLTRAQKKGPAAVLAEVEHAYARFDAWGAWPDDWARWQRAADDARFAQARERGSW